MALIRPEPIVTEPKPAQVYPINHIYNLHVHSPDPKSEASMRMEILPRSVAGELYWKDGVETISTDELYAAMDEVKEVRAVFEAILAAVDPLKEWIAAREELKRQQQHAGE